MIDEKRLIEDILQHENVLASANHIYKSGYRDRQYEIIDIIRIRQFCDAIFHFGCSLIGKCHAQYIIRIYS